MKKREISRAPMNWESLALPIILMLTGLILVIGSVLGVLSLDRIQNLWPGAVIVIGLTELVNLSDANTAAIQNLNQYRKEDHRAR